MLTYTHIIVNTGLDHQLCSNSKYLRYNERFIKIGGKFEMQEVKRKTMKQIIKDLPPDVREELDYYEKRVRDYEMGLIGEIKFQKIRLQLGTYAQRQQGFQMQRIKIPYGGLTSNQLRRLADVSDKYASGFMHLTTRQDVQLYYINIKNYNKGGMRKYCKKCNRLPYFRYFSHRDIRCNTLCRSF